MVKVGRPSEFTDAIAGDICERLAEGESLSSICRDADMPCWRTVHNWLKDDADFSAQVTRAREVGYAKRADDAVEAAKDADDAALGRLAFDAERWYLGKLSNAFRDKQIIGSDPDNPLPSAIAITYVNPPAESD